MVETPNWVGAPVTGWSHDLAARTSKAAWSSPRAGGAANNGPTTENRRCAQRSWTGGLGDSLTDDTPFVRDLVREVGAHPRRRGIGAQRASSAGPTRATAVPHIAPATVVIGARKRNPAISRVWRSPAKRRSNPPGNARAGTGVRS